MGPIEDFYKLFDTKLKLNSYIYNYAFISRLQQLLSFIIVKLMHILPKICFKINLNL